MSNIATTSAQPLVLPKPQLITNAEDLDLNSAPDLPFYLDSTMLSTFRSCPAKFRINHMFGLKPKGMSIHLIAGGAWAAGLQAVRNAQALAPDKPLDHDYLMEIAYGPFIRAWGDYPLQSDHAKNIHNMLYAMELYLQKYHPFYDPIRPAMHSGKPATEFSFAIPLEIKHPSGVPFVYTGRFDLLGYYRENDLLVVLDDKTTGSISASWLNQWEMRGQFLGYLWACMKLGYPADTVVVRGTAIQKTDIKFADLPIPYTLTLIQKWEQELYYSIEQMLFLHNRGHFPLNFGDTCASYGGCPNVNLCKSPRPENWLNNYEINPWSPISLEDM